MNYMEPTPPQARPPDQEQSSLLPSFNNHGGVNEDISNYSVHSHLSSNSIGLNIDQEDDVDESHILKEEVVVPPLSVIVTPKQNQSLSSEAAEVGVGVGEIPLSESVSLNHVSEGTHNDDQIQHPHEENTTLLSSPGGSTLDNTSNVSASSSVSNSSNSGSGTTKSTTSGTKVSALMIMRRGNDRRERGRARSSSIETAESYASQGKRGNERRPQHQSAARNKIMLGHSSSSSSFQQQQQHDTSKTPNNKKSSRRSIPLLNENRNSSWASLSGYSGGSRSRSSMNARRKRRDEIDRVVDKKNSGSASTASSPALGATMLAKQRHPSYASLGPSHTPGTTITTDSSYNSRTFLSGASSDEYMSKRYHPIQDQSRPGMHHHYNGKYNADKSFPFFYEYGNQNTHQQQQTISFSQQQHFSNREDVPNMNAPDADNILGPGATRMAASLVQSSIQTHPTKKTSTTKKEVSFTTIEIRQYERILGDNPSCSSGPPISIGWKYDTNTVYTLNVDEYEGYRRERVQYYDPSINMVLSRKDREKILKELGYTRQQIAESVRESIKTKKRRRQTVNNIPIMKVEQMVERTARKLSKMVLRKNRNGTNVLFDKWKEDSSVSNSLESGSNNSTGTNERRSSLKSVLATTVTTDSHSELHSSNHSLKEAIEK